MRFASGSVAIALVMTALVGGLAAAPTAEAATSCASTAGISCTFVCLPFHMIFIAVANPVLGGGVAAEASCTGGETTYCYSDSRDAGTCSSSPAGSGPGGVGTCTGFGTTVATCSQVFVLVTCEPDCETEAVSAVPPQ